jgi:hypothetical protein
MENNAILWKRKRIEKKVYLISLKEREFKRVLNIWRDLAEVNFRSNLFQKFGARTKKELYHTLLLEPDFVFVLIYVLLLLREYDGVSK